MKRKVPPMLGIHPNEEDRKKFESILDRIVNFVKKKGRPASLKEIADALNYNEVTLFEILLWDYFNYHSRGLIESLMVNLPEIKQAKKKKSGKNRKRIADIDIDFSKKGVRE